MCTTSAVLRSKARSRSLSEINPGMPPFGTSVDVGPQGGVLGFWDKPVVSLITPAAVALESLGFHCERDSALSGNMK